MQIPKDAGSKRNLGIPAVRDRWIEQAVCQQLMPIFEKGFSNFSYGFRPGRKAEQAVTRALEYMNDGYEWIVDLDLTKFFDHYRDCFNSISKSYKNISLNKKVMKKNTSSFKN